MIATTRQRIVLLAAAALLPPALLAAGAALLPAGTVWLAAWIAAALLAALVTATALLLLIGHAIHRACPVHPGCYHDVATMARAWRRRQAVEGAARRLGGWFGLADATWAGLCGADVGSGAEIAAAVAIQDPALVAIGRDAVIDHGVRLQTRQVIGSRIHVGSIRIGAGAVIGARAHLAPDVVVGAGAVVLADACVPPGTRIPARTTWTGDHRQPEPATAIGLLPDERLEFPQRILAGDFAQAARRRAQARRTGG